MSGNIALKNQLKQFSDMQQKAFKYMFDESIKGDMRKAMTAAGYSPDADIYEVMGPMRELLIEAAKDFMMFNSPKAAMNLVKVIEKPEELGNNVRLRAIETLLDRVGIGKVEKVEHNHSVQAVLVLPPKEPVKLESEPVVDAEYTERSAELVEAKEAFWKKTDKSGEPND